MGLDLSIALPLATGLIVVAITIMFARKLLTSSSPKTLIDKEVKYPLKLVEKKILTHDTRIFTFLLPSPEHILGLPVGQHIFLTARINDSLVIRPYTPISCDDDKGYMKLLIKVYFKDVHPKFPEGGKMTQYLENLKIGETIDVRGPNGLLEYAGRGIFKIQENKKTPPKTFVYNKLCMIAGGSGITPMYQMIQQILKDPEDNTQMWLVFANQTEEDILLKDELEDLSQIHKDRFHVWYTVDRPKPGWKYGSGFVSAEMLSNNLCKPGDDVLVTLCGPPPMIQLACMPALDKLMFDQKQRFTF